MKKIINLFLAVCIIISLIPSNVFADSGLTWPDEALYSMPRTPLNNYYSRQNSPAFTWMYVPGAKYELVLCEDKELKKVLYKAEDLERNIFAFSHTIEGGREYYWAVRYKLNGRYSVYNEPYRIYVDEQAFEFTMPDFSGLEKRLKPHPRLFSSEMIENLKKIDTTVSTIDTMRRAVDRRVASEAHSVIPVPITETGSSVINVYNAPCAEILSAAVFYIITGEEKYKKYALDGLDLIKDADPEKSFEWNSNTDIVETNFVYPIALTYDLLYNEMTDEQRANNEKLIERNLKRMFENYCGKGATNYDESLYAKPYGSHSWGLNRCSVAALTIYEKSKLAKKLFDFHFPIFALMDKSAGGEDGASYSGSFYGIPTENKGATAFAANSGVGNVANKAKFTNHTMRMLYINPSNMISNFGDSYNNMVNNTSQLLELLVTLSAMETVPQYREYAKWMLKRVNNGETNYVYSSGPEILLLNANAYVNEVPPCNLPNARVFKDTGYVSMMSDLKDDNRIALIFTSRDEGSYNHGHNDQNHFIMSAYGQELIRDSDYYKSYMDAFDTGWNKKTYAHNTITYDNGTGQPMNSITAKGNITGFVDQKDFVLASGEAHQAYRNLSKADRAIIYIYPDTFITIDDLATKGAEFNFEYWLNTSGKIEFYKENVNMAKITKENASVDVEMHFPKNVKPYYIDFFAGPDLIPVSTPDYAAGATDKRLYFQTDKTAKTKIVTTLSVHHTDDVADKPVSDVFDDYTKISFKNGNVCYVNTGDKKIVETNDGITFEGLAYIYNKDSYMLVKGKSVIVDGREILSSDAEVSAAYGKEEISVSCYDEEANVKFYAPEEISKLIKQDDIRFYDIAPKDRSAGVEWEKEDEYLKLNLFPSSYLLYTDKKEMPGKKSEGILKLTVDDVTSEIPYEAIEDVNGIASYDYWPESLNGVYRLDDIKDISLRKDKIGELVILNKTTPMYLKGTRPEIVLTSAGKKQYETVIYDEPTEIEGSVDVKINAMEYAEVSQAVKSVWWNKTQNNTMQNFNATAQTVVYELDVPESGKYDVVMSISTISQNESNKLLVTDDYMGKFYVPPTSVYSDLQGLRIKTEIPLKAGKNKFKIMNLDDGQCIFDWVGFIKSDK